MSSSTFGLLNSSQLKDAEESRNGDGSHPRLAPSADVWAGIEVLLTQNPSADKAAAGDVCRVLPAWCPDRQDPISVGNAWR